MGSKTGISWTDATWNPWQGCTKVSDGCKNCYMYREKERYGQDPFQVVRSSPATFNAPLKWAKSGKLPEGSRIFVCSWSDFFHKDADPWRDEAWEIMRRLPQYNFLILTKRIERVREKPNLSNIWLGASVENQTAFEKRIPYLTAIPAPIHWISYEPLLGPINTRKLPTYMMANIDWAVIGGESGPGYRDMDIEWARSLAQQSSLDEIKVFVKQLGGWPNTRHELSDFPEDLRIREFPGF